MTEGEKIFVFLWSTHVESFLEKRLSHHVGQHSDQCCPLWTETRTTTTELQLDTFRKWIENEQTVNNVLLLASRLAVLLKLTYFLVSDPVEDPVDVRRLLYFLGDGVGGA